MLNLAYAKHLNYMNGSGAHKHFQLNNTFPCLKFLLFAGPGIPTINLEKGFHQQYNTKQLVSLKAGNCYLPVGDNYSMQSTIGQGQLPHNLNMEHTVCVRDPVNKGDL